MNIVYNICNEKNDGSGTTPVADIYIYITVYLFGYFLCMSSVKKYFAGEGIRLLILIFKN